MHICRVNYFSNNYWYSTITWFWQWWTKCFISKSRVRQPSIRAFMDDLTLTTTSVSGARWILQGLEKLMSWAQMSFKPAKSRSLVLNRGRVTDKFCFRLGENLIPSVTEIPVKSLRKVFNCGLKDTNSIKFTSADLEGWLSVVDKSGLPGGAQ